MSTQQEVIKKFMYSLDNTNLKGTSAINEAIKYCSNSKFTSAQAIINQMVSDCRNSSSADYFLKNYCGIILGNYDTGAITGSDAGGSSTKTAESIVPEYGSLQTCTSGSFTMRGVSFQLAKSYWSLTDAQKYVWNGLYTWWAKNSIDLITASYGSNYGLSGNTLKITFSNTSGSTLATTWTKQYNSGSDAGLCWPTSLDINMYYYGNINTTNVNGYTTNNGVGYLDRTLAHELTHAAMASNIKYFQNLPQFIKEGMAELTHGIDDERKDLISTLAGNATRLSNALNLYNTDTGTTDAYAAGYIFLRYLAKQVTSTPTPDINTITNNTSYKIVYGTSGKDSIYNNADYVTISAGNGNDTIKTSYNYGDYSSISGGSGNDVISIGSSVRRVTVNGGTGNDTITASTKYAGVFQFGNYDGYDVITNYGSGDTIHLTGVYYASNINSYTSGSDYVIYTSGGKITLQNAASKKIQVKLASGSMTTLNDSDSINYIYNYTDYKYVYGTSGKDSIYNNADYVTISAGDGNDTIKTSYNYGDYSSISGGSGNDVISIGSSVRRVTVNGGTGNDTITASTKYAGVFQFGNYDGYDIITNYGSGDTIHLTGVYYASNINGYTSGSDYVIYTSGGKITLQNAASKKIQVKLASGSLTTLNSGYSSNVAELFDDDNFVSVDKADSELDSIVEPKNIGDIEFAQAEKITDEKNLITYAEK